jgi:Xaa-Pro aminopeptidase
MADTSGVMAETSDREVWTSPEERARRLAALREMMQREGFDALVVCGRDDIRYRGRTFYLTDVWQLLAETFVVLLHEGDPIFIGGQVFGTEQAELTDWASEFRLSGTPGTEIARVLSDHGLGKGTIGVVGMTDASLALQHFNELKDGVPDAKLHDATIQFEDVRQTNSEEGLEKLREVSSIFRDIYTELEPTIRPGIRSIELAAQAHRIAREHGLRDPMVLLQTTPFGALSFGSSKKIEKDDIVTVWLESAAQSGFWLEYRRCYSFGTPPEEFRRTWEVQTLAVNAGIAASKAGAPAHVFAETVQEAVQSEAGWNLGYTDARGDVHSMFSLHGIGTDAIQGVWVPGHDRVLRENEVVNIHPTVKFNSEDEARKFGWLGITDNVLITADGGVLMTHDADVTDGFIEV